MIQKSIPESGGKVKIVTESQVQKTRKNGKTCDHQRDASVTEEKNTERIVSYFLQNKSAFTL